MRVSIVLPDGSGRVQLEVRDGEAPWRVSMPGEPGEALLSPGSGRRGFLAEGYPAWLRELCAAVDADRQLAEAIVAEVERRS